MTTANSNFIRTNDQDLLQFSGYAVYLHPEEKKKIMINNHHFLIMATNYSSLPSGLDAMTVKDLQTGNISIIYAGTDPNQQADIGTDASLVFSSRTPQR